MKIFLYFLGFIAVAGANCPTGYSYFDSAQKCYKVVENPYPYFAASDACSLDDGELVSIHNAFQNSYIADLIPDNFMDHWIGLTNMIDGWEYTWQDDTSVDYVHWASGQPNRENGCVVMKTSTYIWETQDCSTQLPFVCIFDPAVNRTCPICPTFPPCPTCPPPPVCNTTVSEAHDSASKLDKVPASADAIPTTSSICPPGYIYMEELDRCYKVVGEATTFFAASSDCNLADAELVSIHSFAENQAVGDLLPSADFDKLFWIGLTNLVDNWGQWAWLDDTPVRYANWAQGNPNNTMGCTTLHMLGYQWTTQYCNLNLPYICEFNPTKSHNCPPCPTAPPCPVCPTYKPCAKPTCDEGWSYYAITRSCYFVGREGTTNADALNRCRSMGADLASIHSNAENSFIVNWIYTSGRLVDDGGWIGAYRTSPSSFANYDGSPMNYTNWAPGEPNNVHNEEYCVEMFIGRDNSRWPDGSWNDMDCYDTKNMYICKKPSYLA